MSNCIGYLFITRDEIWYEVKGPAGHQDHAFRQPHASLKEARQWVLMRNHTNAVEYKFADGKTEHFFRVTDGAVETQSLMTWETPLSYGPMEQAVTNFDAVVRLAEERQRALAPKPIPTVSMNVEPATVEKGQPVTLTWTSSDATSLDLEPGIGPVPARGSKTIVPADNRPPIC